MSEREGNVRVSFKLSQEAAIKLREVALTKSELLCNLGVLAVQLGNESQICVSSAFSLRNSARTGSNSAGKAQNGHVNKEKESFKDASKIPKLDNSVKGLLHVDRGVRPVDQALARATADSVMISDTLPSMSTLNKAAFINKTSSQEKSRTKPEVCVGAIKESCNTVRNSNTSFVENNTTENQSISYDGVIKFSVKDGISQDVQPQRKALFEKQLSKKGIKNAIYVKENGKNSSDETQDDLNVGSVNVDNVSHNTLKHAKNMTACQESSQMPRTSQKTQDDETVRKPKTSVEELPKSSTNCIDTDGQKHDKTDIKMDSSSLSEHDNVSNMTDSFDCSVNNDLPTFPGHGISFAQHLINLSKQYRSENEKSPNGFTNEKFFEPSKFVRNDHVLRSFTTGNEKQEDFMGFSGQNALLFDGNYSTTAVKSAEELSKEQSEASPTNLDSMSETSADSLFEEARLGSVDELSLSPSSNENCVPVSGEENSRTTSPAPVESKHLDNQQLQAKQEKQKRKMKYQRHLKGHSGIICKLCMHPVSKSYSCYKLAHAPKEIRHLFDDGSHCVRVCRRCLPYKSPKSSEKNTQKRLHKTIEKLLK